jgi:glycosyltransferase involved in cell wall biosynthesis
LTSPRRLKINHRVGLVIPYFEAGDALTKSLSSVLLTDRDLILVVDDGSVQKPAVNHLPPTVGETPTKLVTLETNAGITEALVAGIHALPDEYELIARLDCGDTCAPERFSLQRDFLAEHSAYGLVGSWVNFVSISNEVLYTVEHPTTFDSILSYMRVNSAFSHPAVMFRRSTYNSAGGYPRDFPAAEDFALFRKMCTLQSASNLGQILVNCQTGDGGISDSNRKRQLLSRIRLLVRYFDFHPLSVWGIARAYVQLLTPRSLTTRLRQIRQRGDRPRT